MKSTSEGQDPSVRLSGENIESCFVASPLFLEAVFSSSSSEPKPLMPLGKDVAWNVTTEAKLMTPVRAQGMLSDPGAHSILVPQ